MSSVKIIYEQCEEMKIIEIVAAEYVEEYRIRLRFNDGSERIVDFEGYLRNAPNPLYKKYLDVDEFKKFKIVYGNLDWSDYEMCFPIADLYEGNI